MGIKFNSLVHSGRSISKDMTASLVMFTLVVTTLISVFAYQTRSREMLGELHAKADAVISDTTSVLAVPMWNLDDQSVRMVGGAFAKNELIQELMISDAKGRILYSLTKAMPESGVFGREQGVVYNGQTIGNVQIAYSFENYERNKHDLLVMSIVSGLGAIIVIALATGMLLRIFLRKPLEALQLGARQVARGDYTCGFEGVTQLELVEIVEHFGEMSCEVESRERELQRVNIDLRRAERKYHGIFENAQEGIFQTTPEGIFVSANPSLATMLGYDSPGDLRQSVSDMENQLYFDPKDRKRYLTKLLKEGRVQDYELRLKRKDGSMLWVLLHAQVIRNSDGTVRMLEGSLMDITDRRRMEDELRHRALHDPLTALANRALCQDRIKGAVERGRRRDDYLFSVLFVDLDRFKIINDSLGHRFGDKLLVEVGRRLSDCVRELDTVSRYGGDEFIILLEELSSQRMAIQAVKRIREELRKTFALGDHEVRVTASIGIVMGGGDQQATPEELIQRANIAMHAAKESGKNRFKVFTPRMLDRAELVLTLENEMEPAIARGEFFLEYHPIIHYNGSSNLFGFEALVRWNHPTRGRLMPDEFIPVAEESGRIRDLGMWVLGEACRTISGWRQDVAGAGDLLVSVNVSGRQFSQVDLVDRVDQILRETGLPPDRLKLEITETAIMQNAEMAIDKLAALREMGVRISVDDFGTGYSSMSYLQRLPLDSLKIDLSFVRAMDDSQSNVEIVRAIINLAHTLGLEVIAEGVERASHRDTLHDLSCELLQGYYYSRPLSGENAAAFIKDFDRKG
ncbi:putative bifunctional diguanylate cyclase/phosphodiesterase [Desulfovibrio ferrophilus]|uniref:putative bifunctional diguanylate cyclase/phosphodiesterase n=1 Tax=Desulfovibrio ferrophilus TaxID=241368 RepID=UPI001561C2F2|nr:EAL domain-containing protein [Desulfovibrio ferrophilus]